MNSIANSIRLLAKQKNEGAILICTVDKVDKNARTVDCTPLNDGAPLLGVNLQANQESDFGLVQFPKVGAFVVVGFLGETAQGCVLLTDEVEEIQLKIGDQQAQISKDGFVFNGGKLGGLVKIAELEDNLNALKTYVEKLKNATVSGISGITGQAIPATGVAAFNGAMAGAVINFKKMENEKIKQ